MDRGGISIYKEVTIKEFLPDPIIQPKKMARMSMRKLCRFGKSSIKLSFLMAIFCLFLYLTNLAYPARVIGPSGENISHNSSFFILENELNSVSLLNDSVNETEGLLWSFVGNMNLSDADDDTSIENNHPQQINYKKEFFHERNEFYRNGTAGAKYIFGHEYANKPLCARHGRDSKGIIFVHSFPINRKKRMAIRHTWGQEAWKKGLVVAFFMGQMEEEKTKSRVRDEIEKFEDVIIGNFIERYYELPVKTMSMLEWVNFYCNKAPFVIKSDDDVFINIVNLLSFLEINDNTRPSIYGRILRVEPVRNPKSKYYISEAVYPSLRLPPYAQGFCYILHRDVVQDMFSAALNTTYIQFEDLFVTGMVAQKINIPRVKSTLFPNYKHGAPSPCEALRVIGMHKVTADEQFEMQEIATGAKRCH